MTTITSILLNEREQFPVVDCLLLTVPLRVHEINKFLFLYKNMSSALRKLGQIGKKHKFSHICREIKCFFFKSRTFIYNC